MAEQVAVVVVMAVLVLMRRHGLLEGWRVAVVVVHLIPPEQWEDREKMAEEMAVIRSQVRLDLRIQAVVVVAASSTMQAAQAAPAS